MSSSEYLTGFPRIEGGSGSVDLELFVRAANGMVMLVDDLGRVFSPLSHDMSNNISKIVNASRAFERSSLEELLLSNHPNTALIADALLWLKRALHFLLVFFHELVSNGEQGEQGESLKGAMVTAYQTSLQPYHGWVTRQLFSVFCGMCPPRNVVMSILQHRLPAECDEVGATLQEFCSPLKDNIEHMDQLFQRYYQHLDASTKAP